MSSTRPDEPPPAGGFGSKARRDLLPFGRAKAPAPAKGSAIATTLIAVGVAVAVVGTLVVLFRVVAAKYLVGARTAEHKNTLGQMAKDAAYAYEREVPGGTRGVCPSASFPIPRDAASIRGRKYQSSAAEWRVDEARDAGFACLRFEVTYPQYYQYRYDATPTTLTMTAHGDLDADGRLSSTILRGEVREGRLRFASMEEIDPEE